MSAARQTVVVMGVAGCGKSTVAALLAEATGAVLIEGDDLHPSTNIAKMTAGTPLDDADRQPWLQAIADQIALHRRHGIPVVLTCSALKRAYRDVLRDGDPEVWFLHLMIDPQDVTRRVGLRAGHFMPAALVDSQFAALESLSAEAGAEMDATAEPADIVAAALGALTH